MDVHDTRRGFSSSGAGVIALAALSGIVGAVVGAAATLVASHDSVATQLAADRDAERRARSAEVYTDYLVAADELFEQKLEVSTDPEACSSFFVVTLGDGDETRMCSTWSELARANLEDPAGRHSAALTRVGLFGSQEGIAAVQGMRIAIFRMDSVALPTSEEEQDEFESGLHAYYQTAMTEYLRVVCTEVAIDVPGCLGNIDLLFAS